DLHHHRRGLLQGVDGLGDDTPQSVDLPNGTSDVVVDTTPDGLVLTGGGWQSLPMPDGSERWLNIYSSVIMLDDGSLIPPSATTSSGATAGSLLDQVLSAG